MTQSRRNTHGGGARTNVNGLEFEFGTDLKTSMEAAGFTIEIFNLNGGKQVSPMAYEVHRSGTLVGYIISQLRLYDYLNFLARSEDSGWTMKLSKKLKPDEAFFNVQTNSLHIIEKKAQSGTGSVDEKLQTFPFKIRQYKRLVEGLSVNGESITVHYVYCLDRFFQKNEYKDLFDYMNEHGMTYFIQEADGSLKLPLSLIGLED
jgi:hypothetical protein